MEKLLSANSEVTLKLKWFKMYYLRTIVHLSYLENKKEADKEILKELDKILAPTKEQEENFYKKFGNI